MADRNEDANERAAERRAARPMFLPAAAALALLLAAVGLPFVRGGSGLALAVCVAALALALVLLAPISLRLASRSRRVERLERRERELCRRNLELSRLEARARELVEQRGDLAFRRASDGRILWANAAYRRAFGTAPDGTALPPRPEPEPAGAEAAPGQGGRPFRTLEGTRWLEMTEEVVRDARGETLETLVVARDVTGWQTANEEMRRRLEAAQTADGEKSRLVAAVTHEVRTPLGGVVGMADLLLETDLTLEQRSYAEAVRSSAGALLGLVDDVLDHASLDAGRLTLVERPFSLPRLVEEVCELLGPRAEERGLTLAGFVSRKLSPDLMGDAGRLRQILLNLVGNGLKFTDRGGVIVEARTAGEWLEISVRDTGRGIAAADQARIFEAFERAATPGQPAGSGLGLAISHRLVSVMGGTVALKSRRGHGSVFTVRLPLRHAGTAEPPRPALLGRRYVVVSRSRITRTAVARALRDEGARVAAFARTRRLAAAVAGGAAADGALVDLPMLDKAAPLLPATGLVVLLSPSQRHVLGELRQEAGAAYLIKPVRRASLIARLESGLRTPPAAIEGEPRPVTAAAGPVPGGEGRRILLAEDDPVTALLVRSLLERLGHRVDRVADGYEALSRLPRLDDYDLMIVDMNMPGHGGAAVAGAARSREARAGNSRLPILAMSADVSEGTVGTARAAGIDTVLRKPVASDELDRAIRALLASPKDAAGPTEAPPALSQIFR